MEAKAVAETIVQKLRETLNEKSIAKSKVMTLKLKQVLKFLEHVLHEEVILDHLHVLYEVENAIDKFTSRVTRQGKMIGLLMNQPFLFNNLHSCRMLKRNMNKILTKISTSSLDYKRSHQICLGTISDSGISITTTTKTSSAVWPISTIPISKTGPLTRLLSMIPQKKKLTVTYSSNKGFKEENIHDQCFDDVFVKDYNDLRIDLQLLLLYAALFPKYEDIPVRRLLRLWVAEGFVKQPFPEDLVQKHFDDLVDRGMIQITKLKSDNSPKKCRLVSVLQDNLSPKAQNIGLFYIQHNLERFEDSPGPFGVRRLVHYMTTTAGVLPTTIFDPSLLRSFVSFNRPYKDTPAKEVRPLLGRVIKSGICLLRVLDLEGVNKPTLPKNLGQLSLLKYLGLRGTNLGSVPESVGDLSHLETLDVKKTSVESLPDSIWKLKKLRHLNLNNFRLTKPPSSYSTLLTLWGLFLDDKISINEGLGMLLNLQELGIRFELSTTTQGVLLDWIAKLVKLQSLRLWSVDGRSNNLVLKSLVNLVKLSHLNLHGMLERLPAANEFPPAVKVLTLSISQLNKDPMETLGQIPCLMVLRLLRESFTGKKIVCHRGGFKKLEVLKLWVTELEEWEVEEEAMESLKELDIRWCHKLKNIPCRLLLKPRRLEKLILTGMPDDLVTRISDRKSKDTSLTIN